MAPRNPKEYYQGGILTNGDNAVIDPIVDDILEGIHAVYDDASSPSNEADTTSDSASSVPSIDEAMNISYLGETIPPPSPPVRENGFTPHVATGCFNAAEVQAQNIAASEDSPLIRTPGDTGIEDEFESPNNPEPEEFLTQEVAEPVDLNTPVTSVLKKDVDKCARYILPGCPVIVFEDIHGNPVYPDPEEVQDHKVAASKIVETIYTTENPQTEVVYESTEHMQTKRHPSKKTPNHAIAESSQDSEEYSQEHPVITDDYKTPFGYTYPGRPSSEEIQAQEKAAFEDLAEIYASGYPANEVYENHECFEPEEFQLPKVSTSKDFEEIYTPGYPSDVQEIDKRPEDIHHGCLKAEKVQLKKVTTCKDSTKIITIEYPYEKIYESFECRQQGCLKPETIQLQTVITCVDLTKITTLGYPYEEVYKSTQYIQQGFVKPEKIQLETVTTSMDMPETDTTGHPGIEEFYRCPEYTHAGCLKPKEAQLHKIASTSKDLNEINTPGFPADAKETYNCPEHIHPGCFKAKKIQLKKRDTFKDLDKVNTPGIVNIYESPENVLYGCPNPNDVELNRQAISNNLTENDTLGNPDNEEVNESDAASLTPEEVDDKTETVVKFLKRILRSRFKCCSDLYETPAGYTHPGWISPVERKAQRKAAVEDLMEIKLLLEAYEIVNSKPVKGNALHKSRRVPYNMLKPVKQATANKAVPSQRLQQRTAAGSRNRRGYPSATVTSETSSNMEDEELTRNADGTSIFHARGRVPWDWSEHEPTTDSSSTETTHSAWGNVERRNNRLEPSSAATSSATSRRRSAGRYSPYRRTDDKENEDNYQ